MSNKRRLAPSFALLATLAGCVVSESTHLADLQKRDEAIAALESRVAAYEKKGPLHDQTFYDRVVGDTTAINTETRRLARELADRNRTYLETETGKLTAGQQTIRTNLTGLVNTDAARNLTSRAAVSVQLQNLRDRLAEWSVIIGDPTRQDGIYGDRRSALAEVERLNQANRSIDDIRTALTSSAETRAGAQRDYETFNTQIRQLLTSLTTYLSDSANTDAQKIDYITQTFRPALEREYGAHQERLRARPEERRQ